ncbi:hypothetical protein [Methanobrevibacter millerae]|uniref:hypothetical protein n=1 Tax=Methanobrevibacter millerae TaxID=230361 RepID=UPI0026E9E246|nr:hypothetical protein [Methanobrevibacter millerae]
MTFDDKLTKFRTWSEEKQKEFFKHYDKMREEYGILEEENNMLKEALRELSGVKSEQ